MPQAHRSPVRRAGVAALAILGVGCSGNGEGWEDTAGVDVAVVESEIIGGSSVSIATRRALGLVDVNSSCSGSLLSPDWVLTAAHCLNFRFPAGNRFAVPRPDGAISRRTAIAVAPLGTSDLALAQLEPAIPSQEWPDVTRTARGGPTSELVGQNLTCYGRGNTAYASPSGVTGVGEWRSLTRVPHRYNRDSLTISSDANFREIAAPGDSGGVCLFGAQSAAVMYEAYWDCSDPNRCVETITRIHSAELWSVSRFADYINAAPTRPNASYTQLRLQNTWTNRAEFTIPSSTLMGGIAHLRGAMATSATNAEPFELPADLWPSTTVNLPVALCNGSQGRLHITSRGRVTVLTEQGQFADAQCMTSLDGVSFPTASFDSTPLTLNTGWTQAGQGTRSAAARVVNGLVYLEGAIATAGSNGDAFTLPAAFRPSANVSRGITMCNNTKGRVMIQTNGRVVVTAEAGLPNAGCLVSLEGASFPANTSGYAPVSLENGWTNAPHGTRNLVVRNDGGVVRFAGTIASGSSADAVAFTLPPALRPAALTVLPIDLCGRRGQALVVPNGAVMITRPASTPTVCAASFEGATFGL